MIKVNEEILELEGTAITLVAETMSLMEQMEKKYPDLIKHYLLYKETSKETGFTGLKKGDK